MKKIDWYIIRKFIGTFFFAIIILAVIACVIDYTEKIEDFTEKKAPALAILNYFKNFIPHISALLFPLFIFIATIFFTSQMAYKSEVIAILASGVSFQRYLKPYLIGGGFLCTISLLANHWIVPMANKDRIAFEDKYVHNASIEADHNVHLQLSKNLYIYMQSYNFPSNVGYKFTAEEIDGTLLKKKLFADRASYDSIKHEWKLYNVMIRTNDGIKENLEFHNELTRTYPFKPADLEEEDDIKEALTTPQLDKYIAREKLRGRETLASYYVEKHRRTAQPFAGLILTIIGACIASRKIRGGSGLHLAIGIALSAVYIMAMQMSTVFATKAGLNPLIAVWIPNFIFGSYAIYLFQRQIK
jgi:Predicted permeases